MKTKVLISITAFIFSSLIFDSYGLTEKIELSKFDSCSTSCHDIQQQERKKDSIKPKILLVFPKIKEEEKLLVINSIKQNEKVKNASITQDNGNVNLNLIIDYGTSKEQARELGYNFVRLVKTHSSDVNPEKKIGRGVYTYIIVVVYPNKEVIEEGIKESTAESISWEM